MPADLTPSDRVKLIELLQEQDADRRRKTVFATWGSVGFATLVLAVLVFGAWWYLRDAKNELRRIGVERDNAAAELGEIKKQKTTADEELQKVQSELIKKKAELATVTQMLGNVPQMQRKVAVEKQLSLDPKAAVLLPRAYVQIVDPQDREWANEISRRLQTAGIVVPGVEYVPQAVKLKGTDVRYYKQSEREGAEKIVALLKSAGINASLSYLRMEDNTKVRPNHYEVWFAAGSRNTALR